MAATHFQSVLEKRINDAIQDRSNSLANGDAADHAAYRESVGYISGLKTALNLCSDVEEDSDR